MSQLECIDLCLCYNQKRVVEHLSFSLEQGDFLCIVGENGSGKSTLLKGILGMKRPEEGVITLENDLPYLGIGYLPQHEEIPEEFPATVKEIVLSGFLKNKPFGLFYSKAQKQQAGKLMKELEIESLANASFAQLSGGQKQRVLLARAFAAADSLLILDEPITGLDPVVSAELYRLITKRNKEETLTVIMVSHDVKHALGVANKILHLGNREHFFGTTEEYCQSALGQAFIKGESSCG